MEARHRAQMQKVRYNPTADSIRETACAIAMASLIVHRVVGFSDVPLPLQCISLSSMMHSVSVYTTSSWQNDV
jgi:hypothetical protein